VGEDECGKRSRGWRESCNDDVELRPAVMQPRWEVIDTNDMRTCLNLVFGLSRFWLGSAYRL
jgi:hypothetical protein